MRLRKTFICFILIVGVIGLQAGCALKKDSQPANANPSGSTSQTPVQQDIEKQKVIMTDFAALLDKKAATAEVISFIDKNMEGLSAENVSKMIIELEKLQKSNQHLLEEKFYTTETVQEKLSKLYTPDFDFNKVEGVEDKDIKALLTETRDSFFKVETAEGFFFPIINYSAYKKIADKATPDIKAYIELMSVESDNVPAKDAGLVISWEEVLKRGQSFKQFIDNNGTSEKTSDIKALYKQYVSFSLYGANNTPVFDYDTNTVNTELQTAYESFIAGNNTGSYAELLKGYYEVLKKNGFKLTDEVEKYRKAATEKL